MHFGELYNLSETYWPQRLCPRCKTLLHSQNLGYTFSYERNRAFYCDYCDQPVDSAIHRLYRSHKDYLEHAIFTAGMAHSQVLDKKNSGENPNFFRTLPFMLAHAKHFVAFSSFLISDYFLGSLATASRLSNVRVFGVVTGQDPTKDFSIEQVEKARALNDEFNMNIRFVSQNETFEQDLGSHFKMICIDGVLLFTGSANLTYKGWLKAIDFEGTGKKDGINVSSNPEEIMTTHNEYFAPLWLELSHRNLELDPDIDVDDLPF